MKPLRMIALFALVSAGAATAQQEPPPPSIVNAEIVTIEARDGLDVALREAAGRSGITWVAWESPSVPGHGGACCSSRGDACCRGCVLEGETNGWFRGIESSAVALEAAPSVRVLVRLEQGRATRVRAYASDCLLDAAGVERVVWLTGVEPRDSVATLAAIVEGSASIPLEDDRRLRGGALPALALHAAPEAFAQLERWARRGAGELREESIFWLGAGQGLAAVPLLTELATGTDGDRIREKAVFALHVVGSGEAIDVLVELARSDHSPDIRGKALFWLAQSAGERAAATIQGAVVEDPDEDVKRQAVFALSQLPAERGVPLLIRVARTNALPEVRKQAIFWLGQSEDPRAFDFIVGLLER